MKHWIFLLFFLVPITLVAQKDITLKRKYIGKYKGTIPAYQIQTDKEVMDVTACSIYMNIEEDAIELTVGNNKFTGTYSVMFKTKTYYLLEARMEGQTYAERIMVYVRGKKASREGLYPQPMAALEKY